MEQRPEGKAALVTGSPSGIKRSIAVRLGRRGRAAIGVNPPADADKVGAEKAVRKIAEAGGRAVAVRGDVSEEDDAKRMVWEVPIPLLVQAVWDSYQSRDPSRPWAKAVAVLRNRYGGHPIEKR